jgi:hypothetical protein
MTIDLFLGHRFRQGVEVTTVSLTGGECVTAGFPL